MPQTGFIVSVLQYKKYFSSLKTIFRMILIK